MRTSHWIAISGCVVAGIVATGCATPQAALDQANGGAALAISLQSELTNFRTVQADISQARIRSVRDQQSAIAKFQSASAFDDRILRLAGNDALLGTHAALKRLADSRIDDERALEARNAEIDASLSRMLAPIPDGAKRLDPVQQALAALGQELSPQDRVRAFAAFAQEIRKTVDENRKKIEDAKNGSPAAPATPQP